MDLKEQLKSLSVQDRKELLKQLQQEEKENKVIILFSATTILSAVFQPIK